MAPDEDEKRQIPKEPWWHPALRAAAAVSVALALGDRLTGWPLGLWLLGVTLLPQVVLLIESLSDWAFVKVKDYEFHRRQHAELREREGQRLIEDAAELVEAPTRESG